MTRELQFHNPRAALSQRRHDRRADRVIYVYLVLSRNIAVRADTVNQHHNIAYVMDVRTGRVCAAERLQSVGRLSVGQERADQLRQVTVRQVILAVTMFVEHNLRGARQTRQDADEEVDEAANVVVGLRVVETDVVNVVQLQLAEIVGADEPTVGRREGVTFDGEVANRVRPETSQPRHQIGNRHRGSAFELAHVRGVEQQRFGKVDGAALGV